jgi:hypothetical protein
MRGLISHLVGLIWRWKHLEDGYLSVKSFIIEKDTLAGVINRLKVEGSVIFGKTKVAM